MTKKNILTLAAVGVAIVALGFGQSALDNMAQAEGKEAPMFEVDPFWPKPLPNHWILGATIGLAVDSRDHVYIIHRRDTFNERTEIGAATDPDKTNHNLTSVVSVEVWGPLDLDVTAIWDRVQKPALDSDLKRPSSDDLRLTVGLGINF